MSDRLAVFNPGRIEQVGTPAEVYERPATGFVAGFVGVSNVLEGDAARARSPGRASFTIRPEKIAMVDLDAPVGADQCSATGHVREVVYLGAITRYIVALDGGGELVVMEQNLATSLDGGAAGAGQAPCGCVWSRAQQPPGRAAGRRRGVRTDPEEGTA